MAATDGSGFIQVQFDALSTGASDLGVAHQALVTTLEDLDRQLSTTLSDWNSDARLAYQQVRDANRQQTNHLASVLMAMTTHVSNSHENYTSTELRNTSIWA
jgi:WXG100 family type VII secretion target